METHFASSGGKKEAEDRTLCLPSEWEGTLLGIYLFGAVCVPPVFIPEGQVYSPF
jgi:hypothetical protein